MRLGVWLTLAPGLACALVACSGGYPLPPTRCDEWCDATKGPTCAQFYDPASCVSSCEQMHYGAEACRTQLDAVIGCYRKNPSAVDDQCGFNSMPSPCNDESTALGGCVAALNLPAAPLR